MSSKKRSTSSRDAKLRRQAKARAVRQAGQTATDWDSTYMAFTQAVTAGVFRIVGDDGHDREVTVGQMRAHIDAGLAKDGEEPVTTQELVDFLYEDLRMGSLALRSDGMWSSRIDYLALEAPSA